MESREMLEDDIILSGNITGSNGHYLEKEGCAEKGNEDLGDKILVNLESYLDDINDRLTISRMVSNSVIKGMVNAVEQKAAEKIAAKEVEVANLKKFLQICSAGSDKYDCSGSYIDKNVFDHKDSAELSNFKNACLKHDIVIESLKGLGNVADQELKKLKKGVHVARASSIRRISSGSELVGLGSILPEKDSSWVHVDGILESLKMTVDNVCSQANSMLMLSKSSLCDWYLDRDLQTELQAIVMHSLIQSIQEEFEQKLWDQSNMLSGSQTVNWIEKLNQFSGLRLELDAILKLLSNGEGQLVAHGSHDADHFQRKVLGNHVTSSPTLREGNGKLEASKADMPESYDAVQLKHLSKEELVNYFNNIITNMRRDHESALHELTEECFSLKREYLKERGSSLPHKKDKDFEVLKKRITDVMLKLDDILLEQGKLPAFTKDTDNFCSLKDRLDSLLSENHQLRDSLRDKKKELKCMSSQLSDATEKMMQHSSAVANMSEFIEKLNSDLEDVQIKASIKEDLEKCILLQLISDIKHDTEELNRVIPLKQEIYDTIFSGAAASIGTEANCKFEDSEIESMIIQGLCEVIFKETVKDAWKEIKLLYGKYLIEKRKNTSSELKALEKETELNLEVECNQRLKQEVSMLRKSLVDKEKVVADVSAALIKEQKQLELASQELDSLRKEANQQRMLASESSENLNLVNGQLASALEQIESDKVEISKLNQQFEQALKDLEDADKQREMVTLLTQEKHNNIKMAEAKERELKMQIALVMLNVQGLSKVLADFELKVSAKIKSNKLRIEKSVSELCSLLDKAKLLRRTGLTYKQKLEKRCSDLQMAETEVDLLGDEVDTLLNLLEKIYIALDHYSPVLKHYPGIIEILKLIRRELVGESRNPV